MKIAVMLLLALMIGSGWGCRSKKVTRDLSAVKITVGQGGGFTGYYTDLIIYGTGKVERYTSKDNVVKEMDRVPVDSVRVWVNDLDKMKFTGIELDQPGNMNYYMMLEEPNINHKVRWGGAIPPADVQRLYDRIWNTLDKANK
jgi:hypothetical protein